jgi:hypothetical protein
MPQAEFQQWIAYFRLFPFDDFHRYHRPAALVATSFGGGDLQTRLDWLQPPSVTFNDADANTMRALGIKPPR